MHSLREQHACRLLKSTTHVHGLIDMQVHNYSLECSGYSICESDTCMCNVAFQQYCMYIGTHVIHYECN